MLGRHDLLTRVLDSRTEGLRGAGLGGSPARAAVEKQRAPRLDADLVGGRLRVRVRLGLRPRVRVRVGEAQA